MGGLPIEICMTPLQNYTRQNQPAIINLVDRILQRIV